MAFDGRLLNRPPGTPRPVSDALLVSRGLPAAADGNRLAERRRDRRRAAAAGEARSAVDRDGDAAGTGWLHRVLGDGARERDGSGPVPASHPDRTAAEPAGSHSAARCRRAGRARRGPVATARRGDRRRRSNDAHGPGVQPQHDARLSRHGPSQALPAPRRPAVRHLLAAGTRRSCRRHGRVALGQRAPHARAASVCTGARRSRLERARPRGSPRSRRCLPGPRRRA